MELSSQYVLLKLPGLTGRVGCELFRQQPRSLKLRLSEEVFMPVWS